MRQPDRVVRGGMARTDAGVGPASTPTVECWIGVAREEGQRVVRVAGRLSAAQVPELLRACAEESALKVDLADLLSADAAGIETLQQIRGRGATFCEVPGYIQLQLDSPGGRF